MNLSDVDGYPRTAIIRLPWMFVAFLASSGLVLFALAIYLATWIWQKGRSPLPLYGFIASAAASGTAVLLEQFHRPSSFGDALSIVAGCIYVLCSLVLRSEISRHHKEQLNWNPDFNILWTVLFSSVYLNDCLSPDRVPVANEMTSLNLR